MSVGAVARGLTVRSASGVQLVESVDLDVAPGSVLGLVGETGAGKTLTARSMVGLLDAGLTASGTVQIGGGPVTPAADGEALRAALGREISIVLQNPVGMLDPMLRIGRQLAEGVLRRGLLDERAAQQRASELLSRMRFADPEAVKRLYPHQLSGGMAQRIVTALAMMPAPSFLVLDEPTSALDANVRVDVLQLIRDVATEDGVAVIMVSHDLGLVSHFCDTVTVMYGGNVMESGKVADVVGAPAHPYSGALLACSATLVAPLRTALPAIGGMPPAPAERPGGCVFSPRCAKAEETCAATRPRLRQHGAQVAACHFPLDADSREAASEARARP